MDPALVPDDAEPTPIPLPKPAVRLDKEAARDLDQFIEGGSRKLRLEAWKRFGQRCLDPDLWEQIEIHLRLD
jgi:hypothetical protein